MAEIQEITQADEDWIDVATVAKRLKFSRTFVTKLAEQGKLPGKPLGFGKKKYWRFRPSVVQEWMDKTA